MRILTPFRLKGIQNAGDVFYPLIFRCRTCKCQVRFVVPEVMLEYIAGSVQQDCYECGGYWDNYFKALGDKPHAVLKVIGEQDIQ